MQNQATPNARVNARALRRDMTDAERKLWSGLRGEQLGFKFRRQHPLGAYIADFVCLEPKLIIELDGSQHADNQAYDMARNGFFKAQGFAVLRFPSNAPFQNLDGVLSAILHQLNSLAGVAPIPAFPQRGKEPATAQGAKP
ncbi:MAG: endonuclease domain-containing protein [Hydrogenophaga sp.]|nr:endonuclease domain-containing protein [Hydrogenophaga sp.]